MKRSKPSMTKAHYTLIAEIINDLFISSTDQMDRRDIAEHFADELKGTNEAFDSKRFIEACLKK